jgi:ATP-binding cassette subfamily B multidrug efflux pump
MGKVSQEQADARSLMTGRIVDSYTNIATVKLFSHSQREEAYAREAMDGSCRRATGRCGWPRSAHPAVRAERRRCCSRWARSASGCGCTATSAWARSRWPRRWRCACWACRTGSCGNSALFENIGTVRDGISSISLPRTVDDAPGASRWSPVTGDIRFDDVSFHYGKGRGVIEGLDLHIAPGEKIGLVGRSGAGKSTLVNLLLRFYDVEAGASPSTAGHRDVTQDSCARRSAWSRRTPRCCTARCARTSSTAAPTRPRPR